MRVRVRVVPWWLALHGWTTLLGACALTTACGGPAEAPQVASERAGTLAPSEEAALLVRLATPTDVVARRAAVKTLGAHAALGRDGVRALAAALADPDRWVREGAALALRAQGAGAAPAVPELIAALGDVDDYVRWRAAEALGRIGPPAAAARAVLTLHAHDEDEVEVVKAASQKALERIGVPGAAEREGPAPAR